MQTLHQLGARNVLLTLGAQGLYFSNGAQLWFCSAPKIELVSSACAGDAALGAFLSHWLNTDDIPGPRRWPAPPALMWPPPPDWVN